MPRVAQLVDGRVGPQMQAVWALEPILNHYIILPLIPFSQGAHFHKLSLALRTLRNRAVSALRRRGEGSAAKAV